MPTITATPYPAFGRVLVELDWADTPAASCARAVRTVVSTGVATPLTPYINPCTFPGQYEKLSGGRAIFWDNECPLDTVVTYTTDAVNSSGTQINMPPIGISDTFTRVTANGWGTADSGQVWSNTQGTAAWASTNGTAALHTHAAANARQDTAMTAFAGRDFDAIITASVNSIADYAEYRLMARYLDASNWVSVVYVASAGQLLIQSAAAGVTTTIVAAVTVLSTAAAVRIRMNLTGTTVKGKVWDATSVEPDWQASGTITDGSPGYGGFAVESFDQTTAKTFTFDNLTATYTIVTTALTATTAAVTMASNSNFWLRDPGRPCNDIVINLQGSGLCVTGTSGIEFVAIDTETYDANMTLMIPTNAKFPIPVNRPRRDASSTLTLATQSFADRDKVIQILGPGSPLLFSAPQSAYGIPDRYMAIAQSSVARGLSDIRVPRRLEQMPFTTVERPVTTQQGTCNAQFAAMCNIYSTWTAMNAADVTWTKILYGEAGGGDLGYREWNPGVENVFANWLAVKNSKTWGTLKQGL